MTDFRRYALYFAPRPGTALARFGAGWFGHDPETGLATARPGLQGLPADMVNAITAQAARYGFHGTLKAPFFLAKPNSYDGLVDAVRALTDTVGAGSRCRHSCLAGSTVSSRFIRAHGVRNFRRLPKNALKRLTGFGRR